MAYDKNFPANDGYLAAFPEKQRAQIEALINDAIVNAKTVQNLDVGNDNGNIPVANGTECKNLNAGLLSGKMASDMAPKVHGHDTATPSSDGFLSNVDKKKLDTIAENAQVNQNVFTDIKIGDLTLQPDAPDDTIELVAGTNIEIVPDTTNDKITIGVVGKVANANVADSAGSVTNPSQPAITSIGTLTSGVIRDNTQSKPGGTATGGQQILKLNRAGTANYSYEEWVAFVVNHGGPNVYGSNLEVWVNGASATGNSPDKRVATFKYDGGLDIEGQVTANGGVKSDSFLLFSSGSTGISGGGGDTGYPVADQKVNLKISSWYGTGFYDGCTGNGYTVGINHRNGDIVSKGCVTASTFRTSDWFRTTGDGGWYSEKWGGGWQMNDATWIRAASGKNVYTSGVFQADGGFNGPLHGTADYASYLWSTTHKGTYYLQNAWDGTYWNLTSNHGAPVRVGYADNAGAVNGYSADALRNRTSGRNTPVMTPLIDWSKAQEVGTNSGAGLTGQGGGDIYLKQSYKNFDKILVHGMDDGAEWSWSQIFEKWELDYAFGNTYRFILARSGDSCWLLWSGVNLGTSTHPLSTETCWKQQTQNCRIKEIYGLTY